MPTEGVYTVDPASGSVTFDPEPGFLGAATALTYRVADANGTTDTAVLRITVVPDPPVANPDSGATIQGVPVTVDPLTNDLEGSFPVDPSTVELKDPVTGAFSRSVTVAGVGTYTADPVTGKVTFAPDPSFSGNVNPIEYRVADTDGNTSESTIEFTVLGIDPTAVDNATSTPHDTNVTVEVLDNDSAGDPQLPLVPASVRVKDPADGAFKTSVTIPGEGTFTVNPTTGAVVFDPLPSFAGTATVAYRVADKNGTTATAQLSVTTKGAPVANADDTASTPQNVTITVDPLSNDLPGILGGAPLDPSTLQLRDPATGSFGPSVTIPGEGKYTVDPASGEVTFDP
ncbi:MAG: Ig-like domain-containing protein, partial [Angustibacter sp.]